MGMIGLGGGVRPVENKILKATEQGAKAQQDTAESTGAILGIFEQIQ